MAVFQSKYTGEQIERAIALGLSFIPKQQLIIAINYDTFETTASGADYKYVCTFMEGPEQITSVGNYPDIYIIDANGSKYIPEVDYDTVNNKIYIGSNIKFNAGQIVIVGINNSAT